MSDPLYKMLQDGVKALHIVLDDETLARLLAYMRILYQWNQVHNLTAIRTLEEMVVQHLLDSLSVLPFLYGETILDVGSGAGMPGMVIAIVCPCKEVTLLDSSGKKTAFLHHIKRALNVSNVEIVTTRVEKWDTNRYFDNIVSRAMCSLLTLVKGTVRHLKEEGTWFALKGHYPSMEIDELFREQCSFIIQGVSYVTVPYCKKERHLVMLKRKG